MRLAGMCFTTQSGAPFDHDIRLVLRSVSLVIAFSAGLLIVRTTGTAAQTLPRRRLLLGGAIVGSGVAAMHDVGLTALECAPPVQPVAIMPSADKRAAWTTA